MIKVTQKSSEKGFIPSRQSKARNWEVSFLWQDAKKMGKSKRGSFTVLNRAGGDGVYPSIMLKKGTMEYYILDGSFTCNRRIFKKGDYVIFGQGETMNWASKNGGKMLIILKGELIKQS